MNKAAIHKLSKRGLPAVSSRLHMQGRQPTLCPHFWHFYPKILHFLGSHSGPQPLKQKYILGEGPNELFG